MGNKLTITLMATDDGATMVTMANIFFGNTS
jgi:hypothetical protein